MRDKISATTVKRWLESDDPELFDTSIPGFHMRKKKSGKAVYRLRYTALDGRRAAKKLGDHGVMKPDEARRHAVRLLGQVADGRDPSAEKRLARKKSEQKKLSVLELFLEGPWQARVAERRSGEEFLSKLKLHFKRYLSSPMSDLTKQDVQSWQDDMEIAGYADSTIRRLYAELQSVLNFAVEEGMIAVNPLNTVKIKSKRLTHEEIATPISAAQKRRPMTDEEVREPLKNSPTLP